VFLFYFYSYQKTLGDTIEVKLQTLEADLMRTVLARWCNGVRDGEHVCSARDGRRIGELTQEWKAILTTYEKLEDLTKVAEKKRVFFTENLQLEGLRALSKNENRLLSYTAPSSLIFSGSQTAILGNTMLFHNVTLTAGCMGIYQRSASTHTGCG